MKMIFSSLAAFMLLVISQVNYAETVPIALDLSAKDSTATPPLIIAETATIKTVQIYADSDSTLNPAIINSCVFNIFKDTADKVAIMSQQPAFKTIVVNIIEETLLTSDYLPGFGKSAFSPATFKHLVPT